MILILLPKEAIKEKSCLLFLDTWISYILSICVWRVL